MENDAGTIGKINIKLKIAACIIIGVIVLIALFIILEDKRESIKFSAILIAGGAAIYSAFYSGVSLQNRIIYQNNKLEYQKIQIEHEKIRIQHEKSQHSHEFIHLFLSEKLLRLRIKLRAFIKEDMHNEEGKSIKFEDDELYKLVNNCSEEVILGLTTSLGLFESLSISIQLGYVDEEVANRNLDFIVVSLFEKFKPYVNHVRKTNKDEYIYIEVEKLVTSWKLKKYLYSNKDIIYIKER